MFTLRHHIIWLACLPLFCNVLAMEIPQSSTPQMRVPCQWGSNMSAVNGPSPPNPYNFGWDGMPFRASEYRTPCLHVGAALDFLDDTIIGEWRTVTYPPSLHQINDVG